MKRIVPLLIVALLIHLGGVAQTPVKDTVEGFRLPEIPASLTTPEQRADYLSTHYWDTFDFANKGLLAAAETTEPIFADFLTVLSIARPEVRVEAIDTFLKKARGGVKGGYAYFTDLCEKYLWNTESPMRNDDLYLPVLQNIIASRGVSAEEKIRPRTQLAQIQRNRVGALAEDFTVTQPDGQQVRLSEVKGDYIVLFFNSPDCPDCLLEKSLLATSTAIRRTPGLTVMAVYPRGEESLWRESRYPAGWINGRDAAQTIDGQGLYDLRVLPALYLLDKDRKVLLKNTSLQELENYLLSK